LSVRDVLKLAWANLNRMRARVALTAFGVVIGTAAVIILISLGVGLQSSTEAQLGSVGDLTVITVNAFGGFSGPGGQGGGEQATLDQRALDDIRDLPHVVAVTPRSYLEGGSELGLGRLQSYSSPQGIDPDALEDLGWELESGTLRLGRGQIILGKSAFEAPDFGPPGRGGGVEPGPTAEPVDLQGRTITLRLLKYDEEGKEIARTERLRVVGVLASDNESRSAYVAMPQADDFNRWLTGKRRNPRDGFNEVIVKVDDRDAVSDVQAAIDEMGFTSFSFQQILQSMNQVFLVMQAVLGGVGAVALLVAAFGIANTMTMAIYERTREIGIMKAIGATNNDVLKVFLTEAAAIGLAGGLFGTSFGWAVGKVIDLFIRARFFAEQTQAGETVNSIVVTPIWLMVFSVIFATLVGLISGTYPALRAASMKPLRALRAD
jgi:putative ABC transport system permease protein